MKRTVISLLCVIGLTTTVCTYFATSRYNSEFVKWGGNKPMDPAYVERLQGNGIP
ncbi:hypothetical protein SFC65_19555 [Priestia filamentosa]|uniref:hypothetical protein n=1 Tax=Priestia filamentosa TaxID=1402861 RepID=UPI003981C38C